MIPGSFRVRSGAAELAGVRAGKGPPLLLAHPILFSKAYWALPLFAERFEVAAFDQRGHGESTGPVDFDGMVNDIGAVLDHLGWESAAIGGTSLGAATTLGFAVRHPGRVRVLVQDLPGFGPRSPRGQEKTTRWAEAFDRGDFPEAARRITEGLSPPRANAWTDALTADWAHYDPSVLGPKLASALRGTVGWKVVERWPEDLARLPMQVRILAVRGDPAHPEEVARAMAEVIPQATLVPRVPSLSPAAIAGQWVQVVGEALRSG
jgi:pimeloyl-ACP methyl ester carboxylesterase